MRYTFTLLLLAIYSACFAQETAVSEKNWTFQSHVQTFFVGTGDHTGWKIGLGVDAPITNRLSIGTDIAFWMSREFSSEPLFKTIDGYATIDAYPDNYPFPEILIPHEELTDYGIKGYVPQDQFWQSMTADLEVNYLILDKQKWAGTVGLGGSIIKTNYTYINEEWTAETFPPGYFGEDPLPFRMIVPLYVRYIDVGAKVHLNLSRRFKKFNLGVDLNSYHYTSSTNFTAGLVFQVKL